MSPTGAPPRFGRTPHLVDLVAETERLAALVAGAPPREDADESHAAEAAVLASLRLDGSTLDRAPGPSAARDGDERTVPPTGDRAGTWLDALGMHGDPPDADLQALEYAGVVAGLESDDLAGPLLADPLPALEQLHRRLTRGLVAVERAGAPRTGQRAVQDRSVGRIIYFPADPATIPAELGLLGAWLQAAAAREHGLVVSGVLHAELLRIQPFDAANGRLARAAARLVLRARGLDPGGRAAPEPALAADPLGYHEEVARSLRRRDLSIWLERWGEAVATGLRDAARRHGLVTAAPPDRAVRFVATRTEPGFTVADYRADAGVPPEVGRADLERLLDAGLVVRVPGSRGLRFAVTPGGGG